MWAALLDGQTWRRLARDPIAWGAFAIGVLPVLGVVGLGWSLGAVVVLYWLENLVVGAFALVRIVAAGVLGAMKPAGGAPTPDLDRAIAKAEWPLRIGAIAFMGPFFVAHYGMFCFVHGVFVMALLAGLGPRADVGLEPLALVEAALSVAPGIGWFLAAIAVWKLGLLALFYFGRGDVRRTSIAEEMFAPYGRIVALHIAIFAGAFGLALLNEPMLGVLALAAAKAVFDALADWSATRMRVPRPVERADPQRGPGGA
jgi:hypothetical protein